MKSQAVASTPSVERVMAGVAGMRDPAVLDSADAGISRGRYTIVACEPTEVACWWPGEGDPLESMRERLGRSAIPMRDGGADEAPAGFAGGWIGYFAYEAGRCIEQLPATTAPDVGLPLARFALYDSAAIHDAVTGRWTVVAVDLERAGVCSIRARRPEDRLAWWAELLANVPEPGPVPAAPLAEPIENMSRQAYLDRVARAKEYIAAGDIFQVNLARRLSRPCGEPPIITYRRLRRTNPGAYGAYLAWHGAAADGPASECAILSGSPELFLHVEGDRVVTRPIKGTRPRSSDPVVDAAHREELAASDKDRAELAMIVDLERNDLGRVCRYGSVNVVTPESSPADPYAIEIHPTVHHLVATVTGRLVDGAGPIDLLRASFPGGSITGAPKVRAMEIIDELEPTQRSVYTGAIGYFGLGGTTVFNIAIRTLIVSGGRVHLYSGGGIVADSVPADEYEETQAKAAGLGQAVGFRQDSESSFERSASRQHRTG